MTELAIRTDERTLRTTVTDILEEGKVWLQDALERGAPIEEIVAYRASATAMRDTVTRQGLGRDAELDATELLRRCDRTVGIAIRAGQAAGTVSSREHPHSGPRDAYERNGQTIRAGATERAFDAVSPTSFGMSKDELARGIYPMVDDVDDERFDQALADARAERSLSRANVIRKIRHLAAPPSKRPEILRKTRRFDSATVVGRTVDSATGVITSLLDEVVFAELDTQDVARWIASLDDSIKAIRGLQARLKKEMSNR